eukprot:1533801-Rhodomonas_salina.1
MEVQLYPPLPRQRSSTLGAGYPGYHVIVTDSVRPSVRQSSMKIVNPGRAMALSLIHISEPTRPRLI